MSAAPVGGRTRPPVRSTTDGQMDSAPAGTTLTTALSLQHRFAELLNRRPVFIGAMCVDDDHARPRRTRLQGLGCKTRRGTRRTRSANLKGTDGAQRLGTIPRSTVRRPAARPRRRPPWCARHQAAVTGTRPPRFSQPPTPAPSGPRPCRSPKPPKGCRMPSGCHRAGNGLSVDGERARFLFRSVLQGRYGRCDHHRHAWR